MSNFDAFRDRERQDQIAKDNIAVKFVTEGESSTTITTVSDTIPTEAAKFLRVFERADFAASITSAPYLSNNLLNEVTSLDFMLWNSTFSTVSSYYFEDTVDGVQFGNSTNYFTSVTLKSSNFDHITKIEVVASGAASTNAKLYMKIGDIIVSEVFSLTAISQTFTVLVPLAYTGELTVVIEQTSAKAIFLKSIKVYTTESPVVTIPANLVYENREGLDKVYVFVKKEHVLDVGQLFTWSTIKYLIVDIERIVKDVLFNKYLAFECNFTINGLWGWFSGLRDKYIGTTLKQNQTIVSDAKPIVILPGNPYTVGQTIVINGRPWLIIECDDISSSGVTYYSLEATRMAKTADPLTLVPETPVDPTIILVEPLQRITLTTELGYFVSDVELTVSRLPTSVTFEVPFGIEEFNVDVKVDSVVVSKKYKVVL